MTENNLRGQYQQSTLQIKSYRLQYMLLFIFLIIVIYLTIRAFNNPFPFFSEYIILVSTIIIVFYHIVKRFV